MSESKQRALSIFWKFYQLLWVGFGIAVVKVVLHATS